MSSSNANARRDRDKFRTFLSNYDGESWGMTPKIKPPVSVSGAGLTDIGGMSGGSVRPLFGEGMHNRHEVGGCEKCRRTA